MKKLITLLILVILWLLIAFPLGYYLGGKLNPTIVTRTVEVSVPVKAEIMPGWEIVIEEKKSEEEIN